MPPHVNNFCDAKIHKRKWIWLCFFQCSLFSFSLEAFTESLNLALFTFPEQRPWRVYFVPFGKRLFQRGIPQKRFFSFVEIQLLENLTAAEWQERLNNNRENAHHVAAHVQHGCTTRLLAFFQQCPRLMFLKVLVALF